MRDGKKVTEEAYISMTEKIRVRLELILTKQDSILPGPQQIPERLLSALHIPERTLPTLQKPELRELDRMLRKYRDRVGIAYYNLDVEDHRQLEEFLENFFIFAWPESEYTAKQGVSLEIMREREPDAPGFIVKTLTQEQLIYRAVVDKLIRGEELSKDEIHHISMRINDVALQVSKYKDDWYFSLLPVGKTITEGALRVAYQWVFLLRHGYAKVKRCALKGCTNIFIVRSAGHTKRFCTEACKAKSYRRRKKLASST